MKLVLYIDGKLSRFEIDLHAIESRSKAQQQQRIRQEAIKLRRLGENSGKNWSVYLVCKSSMNKEIYSSNECNNV